VPLRGDLAALGGYLKKLQKLPQASQRIAVALAPEVAELVRDVFVAQTSPAGDPWVATKSGAPAFAGSSAMGRVLSRLSGKTAVTTTVLYPLHFHQDGTHRVGRKRGAAIRKGIVGAAVRLATAGIKVPRKQKGESEYAYQQRLAAAIARKNARAEAVKSVKNRVAFAIQEARTAGGWHDPPRPMIPDEGDPIPETWMTPIREIARDVMAELGAEEST
jgi:hypothetical protein